MIGGENAPRVEFGAGGLERLPALVDGIGASRVLVIASAAREALVRRAGALLGGRVAGVDRRAVMHVPWELAGRVREESASHDADLLLALGGGSAIGMAKAVALDGGPPVAAVATTYSGSEMTPIWGRTRDGIKETGRDERVRPRLVVYDPTLTLELPLSVTAPSALNALAHCMEALYASDATVNTRALATDGARDIAAALPGVLKEPAGIEGRTTLLRGAWHAGASLGAAAMGLHHKLAHTLGGTFGLPHAETHAVLLPHTAWYNAPAAPDAMRALGAALGAALGGDGADPARTPELLASVLAAAVRDAGIPASLAALGMRRADLDRAAGIAAASTYPNPRTVTREGVRELLERAWRG